MHTPHTDENTRFPLIALEETDSTNRYLSQLCQEAGSTPVAEFTTVTAEFQTAGKGQRGNSWESERGCNLLFSLLLHPTCVEARRQFVLSQIFALSVKEELEQLADGITIKWPNDIYWHEKKIAGMLIENNLTGHHISDCIGGIGLNVNQLHFRSDAPNPVSLRQITGRTHDRHALLQGIVRRIQTYYAALRESGQPDEVAADIARRYDAALFHRQGFHPYRDAGGLFTARLLRVEPDGRFVLQDEQGKERSYLFKEVQYVLA